MNETDYTLSISEAATRAKGETMISTEQLPLVQVGPLDRDQFEMSLEARRRREADQWQQACMAARRKHLLRRARREALAEWLRGRRRYIRRFIRGLIYGLSTGMIILSVAPHYTYTAHLAGLGAALSGLLAAVLVIRKPRK